MLSFNEEDLKAAVVQKAADEFIQGADDLDGLVAKEVKRRLDAIFVERAEKQIADAIDEAVRDGFNREYQRVTAWGEPSGPKTSIRAELEKTVGAYWSQSVDKRTGAASTSDYNSVTRAEYLMTQICAKDFTEGMKQSVANVTGALKDGLRVQLAAQMESMLSNLFHVKSLADQGKVEKPW
ncbi:MAG TPA: hypothetical protein VEC57_14730 [Candidatus Limnocylindrales bacterium]|nr:hypothetical protein [Candidatus Limnocylindrales bacterium]